MEREQRGATTAALSQIKAEFSIILGPWGRLLAKESQSVLASRVTIANFTSNASRRVVGQWGGAGGACCEDHFGLAGPWRDREGELISFCLPSIFTSASLRKIVDVRLQKRRQQRTAIAFTTESWASNHQTAYPRCHDDVDAAPHAA